MCTSRTWRPLNFNAMSLVGQYTALSTNRKTKCKKSLSRHHGIIWGRNMCKVGRNIDIHLDIEFRLVGSSGSAAGLAIIYMSAMTAKMPRTMAWFLRKWVVVMDMDLVSFHTRSVDGRPHHGTSARPAFSHRIRSLPATVSPAY